MPNFTLSANAPALLPRSGQPQDGTPVHLLLRSMAQFQCRQVLTAAAALADGSTGVANAGRTLVAPVAAVGGAASGSNLADKATTEAAAVTVVNALREVWAKANIQATALGLPVAAYAGGGAAADDIISPVTVSVTGAVTGVLVAPFNTFLATVAESMADLRAMTNGLLEAGGFAGAQMGGFAGAVTGNATVAINTNLGVAASPGVLKAEADAAFVVLANNVATLAVALNALRAGSGRPPVVAV